MTNADRWMLLCALPLFASCSATQTVAVPVPEVVRVLPPLALLGRYPDPVVEARTGWDAVAAVARYRQTLRECDAAMAGLIEWRAGEAAPGHGAE